MSAGMGLLHEAGYSKFTYGLLWMVALGDWQFSRWSVLFARQTNMHVNGRLHTLILHLFSQEENKKQAIFFLLT